MWPNIGVFPNCLSLEAAPFFIPNLQFANLLPTLICIGQYNVSVPYRLRHDRTVNVLLNS